MLAILGNMGPLCTLCILGNDVVDGNDDEGNALIVPPCSLDVDTLGRKPLLPSWNRLDFL